jgi:hypothetical protein
MEKAHRKVVSTSQQAHIWIFCYSWWDGQILSTPLYQVEVTAHLGWANLAQPTSPWRSAYDENRHKHHFLYLSDIQVAIVAT